MNCVLQGVLLTADETVSLAADSVSSSHNAVNMSVCHNGTANHDDDVESSTVSRVRLVQFEKNTADPLVSSLCSVLCCIFTDGSLQQNCDIFVTLHYIIVI